MKKTVQVSVRFTEQDLLRLKQIIEVHNGYSITDETNSAIVSQVVRIAIKSL